MGQKRRGNGSNGDRKKKFKVANGIIDPSTSGIYVTCNRHQEKKCQNELRVLFKEKLEEYYQDELNQPEDDGEEEEELSIEDSIKKELEGLKEQTKDTTKKEPIQFIDLGCECVVFVKTRKPIDPESFVHRLCQEAFDSNIKSTRYAQKLTPITFSVSASEEELKKLAAKVLKPHFHKEKDQEPVKFAIKVTTRNFNTLDKSDIIQDVASVVGNDHGHKVDLKKYDKLILVECFKNNIGMSVVSDYDKLQKFNLQQIFEKQIKDVEGESRVKSSNEAATETKKEEVSKTETTNQE